MYPSIANLHYCPCAEIIGSHIPMKRKANSLLGILCYLSWFAYRKNYLPIVKGLLCRPWSALYRTFIVILIEIISWELLLHISNVLHHLKWVVDTSGLENLCTGLLRSVGVCNQICQITCILSSYLVMPSVMLIVGCLPVDQPPREHCFTTTSSFNYYGIYLLLGLT